MFHLCSQIRCEKYVRNMTLTIFKLGQRCVRLNRKVPLMQSACVYHATNLPLSYKHTWLPYNQLPNKFVTMYRDIHGPTLQDTEAAKEFVFALKQEERERLMVELHHFTDAQTLDLHATKPTTAQLRLVCLHQTLPFIGFGFLDNFLMIIAGEYIDVTLGAAFGISTMAAAGFGNLISDVAGVGSAHYVETFAAKFGVRVPRLTPSQVDMNSTRWASNLGRMLGVAIGCLLGMCPLLFYKNDREKLEEENSTKTTDQKQAASAS